MTTAALLLGALHVRSQSKFWPNSHHHPASWAVISGWVFAAVVVGSFLAATFAFFIFPEMRPSRRTIPYFLGLVLGALLVLGVGPMII